MRFLSGIISDRIHTGDIPEAHLNVSREATREEAPSAESIRRAEGHGMGSGATSARTPTGPDDRN